VLIGAVLLTVIATADVSRGIAMYNQRKFEAAEKELRSVLKRTPKNWTAKLYLARVLVEQHRIPESLAELDALLAESTDPEVTFQAGRIVRELAERRFTALEQVAPSGAPLHELAGRRLELKADLAAALKQYREAAQLEPHRPGIHYLIGNILWRMRELDEAEAELNAELNANPYHGMANLRLGQIHLAHSREAEAISLLERAVALAPEFLEARRDLGKAYRKLGRAADARREWEAVEKARPEDDQIHYLLGNLYRDLGDQTLAARELEKHREILKRRRVLSEER
jgi:tetratricopeptide (TPR) repeat protein